jgi:hypothetical protein
MPVKSSINTSIDEISDEDSQQIDGGIEVSPTSQASKQTFTIQTGSIQFRQNS